MQTSARATNFHEMASTLPFDATVDKAVAAILAAGLTIFARIDHCEAARSVGLSMPPTLVIVYGHPRGGTPVMLASPHAALDLPLRVLIRVEPTAGTFVAFHPIGIELADVGVAPEIARRLAPAQQILSAAFA